MKNKLIILLFLAFTAPLWGQGFLDTIRRDDTCYMFNPYLNADGEEEVEAWYPSGAFAQLYVPDGPTTLYGISVLLPAEGVNNPHYHFSMALYKKTNGMFRLTDSVERNLPMPKIYFNYYGHERSGAWFSDFFVGEEFYFDHPVTVTDSFFIVQNDVRLDTEPLPRFLGIPSICNIVTTPWLNGYPYVLINNSILKIGCHEFTISTNHANYENCEYQLQYYNIWGGLFPITGFHCKRTPRFPAVETSTPTYAVVRWVFGGAPEYEVSVGDYDKPVDSAFAHYIVNDIHCRIDSLEPGHHYGVWVRQSCHYSTAGYDTVVWSPWSNMVDLTTPVGIEGASSTALTMGPNPAHELVQLTAQESMHSISLTDMAGREILQRSEAGTHCVLDLSTLPAGIYIVRVVTDSGQSLRRLIVN